MIKYVASLLVLSVIALVAYVILTPINCRIRVSDMDLRVIEQALDLFKIDYGRYPSMSEGLGALIVAPDDIDISKYPEFGYIKKKDFNDRWGVPYHYYLYTNENGKQCAEIWTYGADGILGGEEHNADYRRYINLEECSAVN